MKRVALVLIVIAVAVAGRALEVRVHPGEKVFVYDVMPARSLYSVVVQNIAVFNDEDVALSIKELRVESLADGRVRDAVSLGEEDLDRSTGRLAKLAEMGLLKLYDFALQTSAYLPGDAKIASSHAAAGGEVVMAGQVALLLHGVPDSVRITVAATNDRGELVSAETTLAAVDHRSPNRYRFPLRGTWYVGAGPDFDGHHRWAMNQEFALDVLRTGGSSGRTYAGEGSSMSDYYAFGSEVLAVADGVVVEAQDGVEDDEGFLRRPAEGNDEYLQRTAALQMKLLSESPRKIPGNFVVVRHEGGEYSFYGHLGKGSVKVEKGTLVKQGEALGLLGGSGNSTEPHLHFHLADGPDPLYSRSLPIRFEGVQVIDRGNEPLQVLGGWIVTAD